MIVLISFMTASVPTRYENVKDVYTKDGLLCLSFNDSTRVLKFPLCNVFCVDSDYQKA